MVRLSVPRRRLRFAPLALAIGVLSAATLGLSSTGTFSAFTASITNSGDNAAIGSLTMKETDSTGATTCLSSSGTNNAYAGCSTINKYGTAAFTPGSTNTTVVRIYNMGASPATGFTVTPAACSQSGSGSATDACAKFSLTVTCQPSGGGTTATIFNAGTLNSFNVSGPFTVPAGCIPPTGGATWTNFTFALTLASGIDNTYQGLTASQNITWAFQGS